MNAFDNFFLNSLFALLLELEWAQAQASYELVRLGFFQSLRSWVLNTTVVILCQLKAQLKCTF